MVGPMIASVRGSLGMLLLFALTVFGACSLSQTAHARKPSTQVHYRVAAQFHGVLHVVVALALGQQGAAEEEAAQPAVGVGAPIRLISS